MNFLIGLFTGTIATFVIASIVVVVGNLFQLWRVLPERSVVVYTFFG